MKYPPMKEGQVMHRVLRAGVYLCGKFERDGERGTSLHRKVTCPPCRKITLDHRAAAKSRNGVD